MAQSNLRVLDEHRAPSAAERLPIAHALGKLLAPWIGAAFSVPGASNVPFIIAWSAQKLAWTTALEEKRGMTMAEGYARSSGQLSLMSVTAGPGATNLATGLLLALRERSPVFVVAGQTPRAYSSRFPVQELDIKSFARDLTLAARELTAAEQLQGFASELVRVALDSRRRGPVLLAVPSDMWHLPCVLRGPIRIPAPWSRRAASRCARALAKARRPLVIAGSGVIHARATPELLDLMARLPRARIAATPRALGVFPSRGRGYLGATGFGGHVGEELSRADLLLVLGSRLHEMSTNFDDRFEGKPMIHVDADPHVPDHAFPAEGYCGDLKVVLTDLSDALKPSVLLRAAYQSS